MPAAMLIFFIYIAGQLQSVLKKLSAVELWQKFEVTE